MIIEHWAIGTVGDAGTAMLTTYVSNRFDGLSPQESFQNVMSSADDMVWDAVKTSATDTFVDAIKAPKCYPMAFCGK